MDWLTVNANAVLVCVTAIYVGLTFLILRTNKKAVTAIKEQSESFYRPYITITHSLGRHGLIRLSVVNTGKTSAESLHLEPDKDFWQLRLKDQNLKGNRAFADTVESFPPGCELAFALIPTVAIQEGMENHPETPTVFGITASYSFGGKQVSEKTTIDLRIYDKSFMRPNSVADEISETTEALTKIGEILMAIKNQQANPADR